MQQSTNYPQYRKYANNRNFFCILSPGEFEEISFIGSRPIVRRHKAQILPDRNLIQDLLHDPQFALVISEDEYKRQLDAS